MMLKEPRAEWLRDAAFGQITTCENSITEARSNESRFSMTVDKAKVLTVEDVSAFLEALVESKRQQIVDELDSRTMSMYFWHDEMAGTLCASLISSWDVRSLPFGCAVDPTATIKRIAEQFLTSRYLEGIPYEEFHPTPEGPAFVGAPKRETLLVHVVRLP